MKMFWYVWLEANPNKKAQDQEYGCPGCLYGFIYVSKHEKEFDKFYDVTFRCDHCRPPNPRRMSMANIESLYRSGYHKPLSYMTSWKYADMLPDPIKTEKANEPVQRKSVNSIVQDIVNETELPF